MGMYTALDVHVKLRWDDDLVRVLGKALFDPELDAAIELDWPVGSKPWRAEVWWCYLLHRMFWLDGGRSFGDAYRRLGVGEGVVELDVRSSYKGITHWDFIEWIQPHAASGFVRWNQEGINRDDVHFYTTPDEVRVDGGFHTLEVEQNPCAFTELGPPGKAILNGRWGSQWHVLIEDYWPRVQGELEKLGGK